MVLMVGLTSGDVMKLTESIGSPGQALTAPHKRCPSRRPTRYLAAQGPIPS